MREDIIGWSQHYHHETIIDALLVVITSVTSSEQIKTKELTTVLCTAVLR